jgi:superfamily II DNA or RNA helicase
VKCAIIARPTMSLAVHMQTAGRIFRPWCPACNGKCEAIGVEGHGEVTPLILDHAGNIERHSLPHEDREWSLEGKSELRKPSEFRMCSACYAYVDRSPCPLCGHVEESRPRKIRVADGELERVERKAKPESSDPKRAYFDKMAEQARSKGFKPGYAAAKYKEKFDDQRPTWAWSQALKKEYEGDAHWQDRVAKRTREREYWADRNKAAAELAASAPEVSWDEPETSGIDDL